MRARSAAVSLGLALVLVVALPRSPQGAAGPTFWTVATAADFLRGTSMGVAVGLEGALTPAPDLTNRLTTAPAQIWSLAEAADGTLWAGTGGDGRVLRLRPGQPEEAIFDAPETNVFAIAVSGSRVYAATSPDGRVYAIENGVAREFFNPEETYIWALGVEATGRVLVATGSPATIYRVAADGTSEVLARPSAAHAVALVPDADGRWLIGTDSPGRVYRVAAGGRPFALLDAASTEIRGLTVTADGVVYAAAVSREGGDTTGGPVPSVDLSPPAAGSAPGGSTDSTRRSTLYQIDPTGRWEAVWQTAEVIYDLAPAENGVFVGTGSSGHLYLVNRARQVQLLTGVDARQITRFAASARPRTSPPSFGTATPGRVLVAGTTASSAPTFTSAVQDTRGLATFGEIRWEATGAVVLHTRSGNTDTPDDSWSDWSGPYTRSAGEPMTSPPARFVQWRAVFTRAAQGPQPRLTSVTVAYLPQNSRPRVTSVTVHPPGVVFQRPFANEDGAIAGLDDITAERRRPAGDAGPPAPSPGRRMFQKGLQTIAWRAEDADTDRLVYSLHYRREGEATWLDLRSGLLETIFVWDTTTVPDGRYLVRVTASDELVNPDGRALAGVAETEPISIDNTPPVLTVSATATAQALELTVRAEDAQSAIQKVEYSIAGGPWRLAAPLDGLADGQVERYTIVLPPGSDLARVSVRATDQLQNVATVAPVRR